MRLQVKGRNVEVSDSIRRYAEGKLAKLEKLVKDPTRVEVELHVEKNPSISDNHVAEATVFTKGPTLRARESSDKLERKVKRYREKRRRGRPPHGVSQTVEEAPVTIPTDSDTEATIVKTKQFAIKPMTAEEAVLQLDLIGHDFFVFKNAETETMNVVYRRRDGNYGLIEPE
jgi:putative sigma-54 modulation protein